LIVYFWFFVIASYVKVFEINESSNLEVS